MKPFDSIKALSVALLLASALTQGVSPLQASEIASATANIQSANTTSGILSLVAPASGEANSVLSHSSHCSHSSHASHSSHRSHYSGSV